MFEKSAFSKNLVAIFVGQFLSLFLNFLIFAFLARNLGIQNFGEFSYWIAIVGILAKIIDFGFNPIVFRNYSKEKDLNVIHNILAFRYLSIIILLLISVLVLSFISTSLPTILILLLIFNIGFSHKYTNIRDLLYIPYKVDYKMVRMYMLVIAENIILLVFVILMPALKMGLNEFIVAYVVVNFPATIIILFNFFKISSNLHFSFGLVKNFLKESFPIYGFVFFSFVYLQTEIILIEYFLDKSHVGLYSAAIRLTRPLELVPSLIITGFFPLIVRNITQKVTNDNLVRSNMNFLNFISVTFAVLISFKSQSIVTMIFGNEYSDASSATSLLAITLFFTFLNFYYLDLLTAYGKQKFNFIFILIVLLINIFINILVIPEYQINGAAAAKIFSSLIGFIFLSITIIKKTTIKLSLGLSTILYILILTSLIWLISALNIIFYFILALPAVVLSMFLSKILDFHEIMKFLSSLLKSRNEQ